MKKTLLGLIVFSLMFTGLVIAPVQTQAATAKKVTKTTTVKWASSGLSAVAKIRNSAVRTAYKKKVESYAKRNHIALITSKVVTSMRE